MRALVPSPKVAQTLRQATSAFPRAVSATRSPVKFAYIAVACVGTGHRSTEPAGSMMANAGDTATVEITATRPRIQFLMPKSSRGCFLEETGKTQRCCRGESFQHRVSVNFC